ncbi:MAG TPA: hypothetical protein H9675_06605 [Firmicutes bacterium]|nr:hypothetical protein [Bacillota bacterium]
MKRLYGENIIDLLPVNGGFVFAIQQAAYDDKVVILYKLYSFNTGVVSPIKKSIYLTAKFGPNYTNFENMLMNYISCASLMLPDEKVLICNDDGTSDIFDKFGNILWSGKISHNDEGPTNVILCDDKFWCSFPKSGVISKYNTKNVKEELRFGGPGSIFTSPSGIIMNDGILTICCSGTNKIYTLNTNSFEIDEYAEFSEPVYKYFKINSNEIVLLDSGIYRI